MSPKFIVVLLLGALLVVFTAQNAEVVQIRFLFWKLEMSRAIVLFFVFGAGALVGWLVPSVSRLRNEP